MDGAYAAVRFPTNKDPKDVVSAINAIATGSTNKDGTPGQSNAQADDCAVLLQDCRLMRKDELQVVKWSTSNKSPDCFQKIPRKLSVPADVTIMSLAVSNSKIDMEFLEARFNLLLIFQVDAKGVHAVIRRAGGSLGYALLPLGGARALTDSVFPTDSMAFLGNHPPSISLTCAAEVNNFFIYF